MSTLTKSKRKPKSKSKIAAAARLQKARQINLPEFRDRIQSYLEDDVDDSVEPIRCHDLQHFIRNFKAAPNVFESSYRPCRVCANDMIDRALKARDSDLAVIASWGGKLRMSITSTDKEFAALKRKINRHKIPYWFIHGEGHKVVMTHPDSDIGGGVLHDTYESSLEVLNMVYSQLVDPTVGDCGLTTSRRLNGTKARYNRDVPAMGATGTPPTDETPPVDIDSTETPSVPSETSNTSNTPKVVRAPASMNPDDWTDDGYQPDPVVTEEELYTSRMHEHDTPYSKLPRDVRRALSYKDNMTKFRKAPKGYMELARTHHAEHFIVLGKQLTWIPLKYWEEFKKELANPNRQVAYA